MASRMRGNEGFPSIDGQTIVDIGKVTLECLSDGEKRNVLMRSQSTASAREGISVRQVHDEDKRDRTKTYSFRAART